MKRSFASKYWVIINIMTISASFGCSFVHPVYDIGDEGLSYGCAVGDVTSHEAVVWMKTTHPQNVMVQYTTGPSWSNFGQTAFERTEIGEDLTAHIRLSGLQPRTRYRYRGLVEGRQPGPECQFLTSPLSEEQERVTFVVGGDTRHGFQPFSVLSTMSKEDPDFFIYLGDTIYADKDTPARTLEDYWAKYKANRDQNLRQLLARTSVYVMWDDHEVDSDFISTNKLMPVGRQAFFDYWPIRRHDQEAGRLYRSFRWGKGVEIFLLDTRQYRNPATGTMLGMEQKGWLLEGLANSSARFKFIVSSVPFSDPREDKWGEYPGERDEILQWIRDRRVSGVIFLAGDIHLGAVSRIPGAGEMKEFIFGPLAAPMNYKLWPDEPRFEFFYDHSRNYGKVSVQPEMPNPSVRIEWYDQAHRLIHRVVVKDTP